MFRSTLFSISILLSVLAILNYHPAHAKKIHLGVYTNNANGVQLHVEEKIPFYTKTQNYYDTQKYRSKWFSLPHYRSCDSMEAQFKLPPYNDDNVIIGFDLEYNIDNDNSETPRYGDVDDEMNSFRMNLEPIAIALWKSGKGVVDCSSDPDLLLVFHPEYEAYPTELWTWLPLRKDWIKDYTHFMILEMNDSKFDEYIKLANAGKIRYIQGIPRSKD